MSSRLASPRRPLTVLLTLALVGLITLGGTRSTGRAQVDAGAPSGTQVIAQGVVPFTGEAIDWRVYDLEADPGAPREPFAAATGFTLADTGALLVTDDNTGRRTLLGPGEATVSLDGDLLRIETASEEPVGYTRIVLLPDEFQDQPGGEATFESDAFEPGAVSRDVDLLRGTLDEGEEIELPAGALPSLVLVTDGDLSVTSRGGDEEPATLSTGDATTLTEDATLSAEGDGPVTFVAAVVGSQVAESGAVVTDPDTDSGDATPEPDESGNGDGVAGGPGSLTLSIELCPLGGVAAGCDVQSDAALIELTGAPLGDSGIVSTEGGVTDEGYVTFNDLPLGEYTLQILDLVAPGDVVVTGDAVTPTDDPLVYIVTIDETTQDAIISIQVLPITGEAELVVNYYRCPASLPIEEAAEWFCAPDTGGGWSVSLSGSGFGGELTSADAPASDFGLVFPGLPLGTYSLILTSVPEDVMAVGVRPGVVAEGPIRIELDGSVASVTVAYFGITAGEPLEPSGDSDEDGLADNYETDVYGTDPASPDTDGDGSPDGKEVTDGTNPFDPASAAAG